MKVPLATTTSPEVDRQALAQIERNGLGLALSGGGFRATLYHMGVVRCLRERGLLPQVRHIASVSGGSVLGAHLVLNWSRYLGTEAEFDAACDEVVSFVRSDVRGHILRAWLLRHMTVLPLIFAASQSRMTSLLRARYDSLYHGALLENLNDAADKRTPTIHILSTSFTTGKACALGPYGFISGVGTSNPKSISAKLLPVSVAVAASSAFPPLFPPVGLTRRMLNVDQEQYTHTQYLGDGGVFDNLGVRTLTWLQNQGKAHFERVILSDAGARIDWHVNAHYGFVISRSIRATDVLMQRVSDLEYEGASQRLYLDEDAVIALRIDHELRDDEFTTSPPEVQRATARIRTDLDVFSPTEINALVRHGYAVASVVLARLRCPGSDSDWLPTSTRERAADVRHDRLKLLRRLEIATSHRWRLWSWRDGSSWLLTLFLLALLGTACWPFVRIRNERRRLISDNLSKTKQVQIAQQQAAIATGDLAARAVSEGLHGDAARMLNLVFERQGKSVVRLVVQSEDGLLSSATGFFVGSSGEIVTAGYAVREPNAPSKLLDITVYLPDGSKQLAQLIYWDARSDVALLKIDRSPTIPIEFAASLPPIGTPVIALTFVGVEQGLSAHAGRLVGVEPTQLRWQFDETDRFPGGAGGPVVEPDGRAIGVYMTAQENGIRSGLRSDQALRLIRRFIP